MGGSVIIDQQVIELESAQQLTPVVGAKAPVASAPISVLTSDALMAAQAIGPPVDRFGLHAVVLATKGAADHVIDFVSYRATPETVLHIQPGQVVQWPQRQDFNADVLLISPDCCPPGIFESANPRPAIKPGPAIDVLKAVGQDLRREQATENPSEATMVAAARFLLERLATATAAGRAESHTPQAELLRRFQEELERSFFTARAVSHYAGAVGASSKTLSRATASVAGCSPKEIVDRRVILEARRLLAHTTHPSSAIGTMLGFSEPTNFTKFFVRNTGMSPQEFRVSVG